MAYNRAIESAAEIFNKCPLCKRLVCDNCFMICEDIDMCADCANELNEKGERVADNLGDAGKA